MKYSAHSALDKQEVYVANITDIDTRYLSIMQETSKFIDVSGHISLAPSNYEALNPRPVFSFYLTPKDMYLGVYTFGDAVDVGKYAKKDLTEKDIMWTDLRNGDGKFNIWAAEFRFKSNEIRLGVIDTALDKILVPKQDLHDIKHMLYIKSLGHLLSYKIRERAGGG